MIFKLIIEFFKVGLFSVGGGLATIPFLQEMSIKYGWFSLDTLSTMIAVSESTPGPIGINMATYIGYITLGIYGGIISTLSLVAPSVIVIVIIAKFLKAFKESKVVKSIFYGIRPVVVALILSAFIPVFNSSLINKNMYINFFIALILAIIYKKFKCHPVIIIILSAIVGVIIKL